jgi:hypothetical protein
MHRGFVRGAVFERARKVSERSNLSWMTLTFAGMLLIPCMPASGTIVNEGAATGCVDPRRCDDPAALEIFNMERARRNYLAVARGAKSLNQLPPVEAQELLSLIRQIEANRANGPAAYERCRDQQLGGRTDPTELELRLIDLKCAMR